MNQNFYEAVVDNPIIAAVKNMEDVTECCKHDDIRVIFILFGDVCSIDRIVKRVKGAGKVAMVHVDLISGLSPKEISVEYLKEHTEADGIISTKPSLIKKAKELGHTVLLDPVGAGASTLRTKTALSLLEEIPFDVVRGNISEIKTISKKQGTTKGVDADCLDTVTKHNLSESVAFAKSFAIEVLPVPRVPQKR